MVATSWLIGSTQCPCTIIRRGRRSLHQRSLFFPPSHLYSCAHSYSSQVTRCRLESLACIPVDHCLRWRGGDCRRPTDADTTLCLQVPIKFATKRNCMRASHARLFTQLKHDLLWLFHSIHCGNVNWNDFQHSAQLRVMGAIFKYLSHKQKSRTQILTCWWSNRNSYRIILWAQDVLCPCYERIHASDLSVEFLRSLRDCHKYHISF